MRNPEIGGRVMLEINVGKADPIYSNFGICTRWMKFK